ncbi:MAG: glycosyl transferase family 51, partial [Candidatus Binatia bacterium]
LEKYRHSPEGRTESPVDKLSQVAAASLKAYRDGFDTRPWRKKIILEYVNSMPLSAAPGYGEVYGLGDGLWAWFGLRLSDVRAALASEQTTPDKVVAYKSVLALVASLPAPTTLLVSSREALADRADHFTALLADAGVLDRDFADVVLSMPIKFLPQAPPPPRVSFALRKAPNAIRSEVARLLGVAKLYDLDRLHLEVASTIDVPLQNEVIELFQRLRDPMFVAANGLRAERLLDRGDPGSVVYSLLLYEQTPEGNLLRAHADNLDRPFDLNRGMKLELGSTAKLRTIAHYLELVAELHAELTGLDAAALRARRTAARDPLTVFATDALARDPQLALEGLLERALERRYSATPAEGFFTGGGLHTFHNFDRKEDGKVLSVRDALRSSTNLVFIRLMRDLVRYHEARLGYDAKKALADQADPVRLAILGQAADSENRLALASSCRTFRNASEAEVLARLSGDGEPNLRDLALVFFAWNPSADESALFEWIRPRLSRGIAEAEARKLFASYGRLKFGLADYAYLLGRSPVEIWCAGELVRHPELTNAELYARSGDARRLASQWLFKTGNRRAQDIRVRVRIEQDAFARMTPYWRRLGFPFTRLVPSLATSIGSSTDRPAALADLMGIIVSDGRRRMPAHVRGLRFAAGTPYETVYASQPDAGDAVMHPSVARALRATLAGVVTDGTARRLNGAFVTPDGKPIVAGGKTGSGDNRHKTFARGGGVISSRAINRTATFVFYVGDRYFGVMTAFVPGAEAAGYKFTSALPVSVLKLLAPSLNRRLAEPLELPADASLAWFADVAASNS